MKLVIVKNDTIYKEKLLFVKKYFKDLMLIGILPDHLSEAYKLIKVAYDVTFCGEILMGLQKTTATFWPIKNEFVEGEEWLNSEIGHLYQEVVYYFAYHFEVPKSQLGGFNVITRNKNS